MNLILSNGYPFPYHDGLTEAQQEEISQAAPAYRLVIAGVVHFEQKHTTTVEFADEDAFNTAHDITGWQRWSEGILEAPTSAADGYDYPAIIVGNVAYCGHQVVEPKVPPVLPLFYVRDAEGGQDLLVRSATVADALAAWRKHYERGDELPNYIGQVPLDTAGGAIDWDLISGNAMHYKEFE